MFTALLDQDSYHSKIFHPYLNLSEKHEGSKIGGRFFNDKKINPVTTNICIDQGQIPMAMQTNVVFGRILREPKNDSKFDEPMIRQVLIKASTST